MPPTAGNRALLAQLNGVNADMGLPQMGELDPAERGAGDISFVAKDVSGLVGFGPACARQARRRGTERRNPEPKNQAMQRGFSSFIPSEPNWNVCQGDNRRSLSYSKPIWLQHPDSGNWRSGCSSHAMSTR
jgi:hypothetical protein